MNSRPIDLSLFFRVGHAAQLVQESLGGVHDAQIDLEMIAKDFADAVALAGAQQAIVDENAGEPVADGAVEQGCDHRGIDAARQAANDPAVVANLGADFGDGFGGKRGH